MLRWLIAIIIILAAMISLACYEKAERNRYAATITQAMELVAANYVDEIQSRELFENAMDGMMEGLDPYSSFISPWSSGPNCHTGPASAGPASRPTSRTIAILRMPDFL